jgi:hypothetical protein
MLELCRKALRRVSTHAGSGSLAVPFEQAVYGSFSFRDEGYALLAHSPGCRARWLAEFRLACQRLGERPAGVAEAPGLFALRLPCGPWLIVGVSPQGRDDRGRPGALAFHGLFVGPREYRKTGFDPFAFCQVLRSDWDAETTALAAGSLRLDAPVRDTAESVEAGADERAARMVAALVKGQRVALEVPDPIDALARQVWRELPLRIRKRASVATWAFGNDNRFSLLAVPRLAGVALDSSYVDPLNFEAGCEIGAGDGHRAPMTLAASPSMLRSPRALGTLGAAGLLAVAGVWVALHGGGDAELDGPYPGVAAGPSTGTRSLKKVTFSSAPVPLADAAADREEADPAERRRTAEALDAMADRFGVGVADGQASRGEPDPVAVMERLAGGLRYEGPLLSEAEREELARDRGHDARLALRWDALIRCFVGDRPLPANFRAGRLRWQVDVLAWLFHRETDASGNASMPRRSASEAVHALAEALAVDVPLRPTPLTARFPALTNYMTFLARLPRR